MSSLDPILDDVTRIVQLTIPEGDATSSIDGEADLTALGIDSLGRMTLMIVVEEKFKISFPDDLLGDEHWRTPQTISQAIRQLRGDAHVRST